MFKRLSYCLLCLTSIAFSNTLYAEEAPDVCKVDIGPAYLRMRTIESGDTKRIADLYAVRLDASLVYYNGWTLKPMFMYGKGNDSSLLTFGAGFGHYIPVWDYAYIAPMAGCAYSYYKTQFPISFMGTQLEFDISYKSASPYLGVDIVIPLGECWRIGGTIQYAWTTTKTEMREANTQIREHSGGFTYALQIEGDVTDTLSLNISGGVNNSLTKEKHGLQGYGVKAGIAYWF